MVRISLRVLAAAVLLVVFGTVSSAEDKKPLTELQKQIKGLQDELAVNDKEQSAIDVKAAELNKTGERLTDRYQVGVRGVEVFKGMRKDWGGRYSELERRIRDHNVSCDGTFEDKAYVARCNSEKGALENEQSALRAEAQKLESTRMGLQDGFAQLDREKAAWDQASNETLARQESLNVKVLQLKTRILSFLEDLKKREKLSTECKDISNPMTAGICLHKVWDGAK